MNSIGSLFKPKVWLIALLFAAFVAGCGGGGGGGGTPPAALRTCEGPNCVDLKTAGHFAVLASQGIFDTAPSRITGDIGVSGATVSGTAIGVSCTEVTGTIYATDALGPAPCSVEDPARLTAAETAISDAFLDADSRTPDSTDPDPAIAIAPGVYNFASADVAILTDVTLSGNATDVWIFQITGHLTQTGATNVILAGSAKAKNIFWRVGGNVEIGTGATFEGIVLASGAVTLASGAVTNGRLFSETIVDLDTTTVTHPAP